MGLKHMRGRARTRSEGPIAFVKTNLAAILDCLDSLNGKTFQMVVPYLTLLLLYASTDYIMNCLHGMNSEAQWLIWKIVRLGIEGLLVRVG